MNTPNVYDKQLTDAEIREGAHRRFVGGLWKEIGELQFDFLVAKKLKPNHKFLDVGCGALRGGIHFIRYLETGNYYGLDLNRSLIRAGNHELDKAGLTGKCANLLVDDQFNFAQFQTTFDFALALSVFTHLPMNNIVRSLKEMSRVLSPEGVFYATFFEASESAYMDAILHDPGQVTTYYDSDPFHYSLPEIKTLSDFAGLDVQLLGDWNHPRNQKMLAFSIKGDG